MTVTDTGNVRYHDDRRADRRERGEHRHGSSVLLHDEGARRHLEIRLDIREEPPVRAPRRIGIRDVAAGIGEDLRTSFLDGRNQRPRSGTMGRLPNLTRRLKADYLGARGERIPALHVRDATVGAKRKWTPCRGLLAVGQPVAVGYAVSGWHIRATEGFESSTQPRDPGVRHHGSHERSNCDEA